MKTESHQHSTNCFAEYLHFYFLSLWDSMHVHHRCTTSCFAQIVVLLCSAVSKMYHVSVSSECQWLLWQRQKNLISSASTGYLISFGLKFVLGKAQWAIEAEVITKWIKTSKRLKCSTCKLNPPVNRILHHHHLALIPCPLLLLSEQTHNC